MPESEITCSADASLTSPEQVEEVLHKQGITLSTSVHKIFRELVAGGKMAGNTVCHAEDGAKDGPFLMVVKILLPNKEKYGALLAKLTGNETIALLFEPSGPAYVRVVRCRPSFWNRLKQSCIKCLGRVW